MQNWNWIIAILCIAFGLYLLDFATGFYAIPAAVSKLNNIIFGIAGILLLAASFKYFSRYPI